MSRRVLFCNCGGEIVKLEIKESIARFLKESKVETIQFSDLCSLCVSNKSAINQIFSSSKPSVIAACHPRAIKKLLEFVGVENNSENLSFINLREASEDEIIQLVNSSHKEEGISSQTDLNGEVDWPSWYPVIDYDRCTACGQCADFCLFGVYEKTEGRVNVVNPKGCKNNCPACARICPQTAIIFPKYKQGGAISGSDSIDEIAEQQRLQQDMNQILGSDIYKALEMRKAKRQSIIKADAMKKAIEERDKAKGQ